jgi:hypothetical protein
LESQSGNSCQNLPGKQVLIRTDAFAFCRYGVMVLIWVSLFLHSVPLLYVAFGILFLSAVFSVRFSPLIILYTYTVGLLFDSPKQSLGVNGMRFAHILGSIFAGAALVTLHYISAGFGWGIVGFLAIMKTVSAIGLCPAYKLYNCYVSGGCCSITKRES